MPRILVRVVLLLLATTLFAQGMPGNQPATLVFEHATVIDATGAPPQRDMTVTIAGGRIRSIAASTSARPPQDAIVVNATGKFLIPGLWDMGVTGMRIMWGDKIHHEWKRESAKGELLVPHLVIASQLIDGPKPFWPGSVSVSTEANARAAVVEAKKDDADFVKVYSFLPREEYFAIVEEAKRQGIPFAGHLPLTVTAEEASNAGQRSFEHLLGVLPALTSRSDEFMAAARADFAEDLAGKRPQMWGDHYKALREAEINAYSPEKAGALFAVFKKNNTWQVPTLTLLRSLAYVDDVSFTQDPRLKYIPAGLRRSWRPENARDDFGPATVEDFAFKKREFQKDLEVVGAMQKAGVGILAGTDTSNPFCMPGFSLHDELNLMVKAGLSPLEALQTATRNPARFLHREDDFGTVEEGKVADLVLLDADPLQDIANTTRISAVIYGGRIFDRAALDKMLADVQSLAALGDTLMQTAEEKGAAAAVQQYRALKKAQPSVYAYTENDLVELGYLLLRGHKVTDAIEVFKLSVEEYPKSFNTWDSLAEAYMDHGDKSLAIADYKKSLELNPKNTNATEKLKELALQ